MSWTQPADLKAQLLKQWERGALLSTLISGEPTFPLRLTLKGPTSTELSGRFEAVRSWIAALQTIDGHGYRIVWREVRHRIIGSNRVPAEIWVDSLEGCAALLGRRQQLSDIRAIITETQARQPALLPWLQRYPLKALSHVAAWSRLLDTIEWLQAHPRPEIYLRQVDIPGVDSKWIEGLRGLLTELLDLTLPSSAIDPSASGVAGFCRRYGFRDKPVRVRLRMLDPTITLLPATIALDPLQEITLTHASFSALTLPIKRLFITENEINFLAFPLVPNSMVIFGGGYGFEMLAQVPWLQHCPIHYWGDIDTHGFAIIDQLRAQLPHSQSLLMDRATLLAHQPHWGEEPKQELRELPRLQGDEVELYNALRDNRLAPSLRLEQERIGYVWLEEHLKPYQ